MTARDSDHATIEEGLGRVPSLAGGPHRTCIVDENVILNRTRPLLMTEREQEIPYAESA